MTLSETVAQRLRQIYGDSAVAQAGVSAALSEFRATNGYTGPVAPNGESIPSDVDVTYLDARVARGVPMRVSKQQLAFGALLFGGLLWWSFA